MKLTTDKFKLMKLLKENNLNTGNFYKIDNFQDAERVLKNLDYPNQKVVFKPRDGRGSRVLICDSKKKSLNLCSKIDSVELVTFKV